MKYTGLLLASLALSIESALQKHENFHQYNLLGVYANGQGRQVPRNEVSQQPPLTRGWATQYAHAESSQGPCKGIVESVFAVPTGVCLTGLTSVQSSFEYVCNATTVIRNTYYGLGCDQNQLANSAVLNNNEESCAEATNDYFDGRKYLSFLCTDNTKLPLPNGESYVMQTSFNQVQCMGEVTGFVGLKNDYCFALKSNENNDDISVIDDKDDDNNVNNISTSQRFIYPNLRIYNTSSTCQGPFSAEPIPVGCNSVPDPDTQGLSYEFSLKTGGQERLRQKVKRLLKASIKDEMVDNVAGFLIFAAIIIGLAICIAYITSSENQHCYQAVQIAMADKSTRENL